MSKAIERNAEKLIDRLYDIQDDAACVEDVEVGKIIAEESVQAASRIDSRLDRLGSMKPKNTGISTNDSGTIEVIKNAIAEALAATGGIEDEDLQEQLYHLLYDVETAVGDTIVAYSAPTPAE